MCVRIIMVTLTFDSFLRSDRSSRIYNSHFSFLLLMMMEIYIVLLRYILLPFNIRRLIFCCCSFSGNLLIVLFENLVCSFCCSYKVEILVSIPFVGLDVVIATRTDRSSGEDSSIVTIFISLLSQIISFWLVVALFTCPTASSSFCRSLYNITSPVALFSLQPRARGKASIVTVFLKYSGIPM